MILVAPLLAISCNPVEEAAVRASLLKNGDGTTARCSDGTPPPCVCSDGSTKPCITCKAPCYEVDDGTCECPLPPVPTPVPKPVRMIGDGAGAFFGDVDGDGKTDLVGVGSPTDADAGVVFVAKSNGSGFPGWTWKTTGRMLGDGARALLGDVTGDRRFDLVGVGALGGPDAGVVYLAPSVGLQFSGWTWWSSR